MNETTMADITAALRTDAEAAGLKRFVIRDELGHPVEAYMARDVDHAIELFCYPALRKEAYFGPGSGWTCAQENAP